MPRRSDYESVPTPTAYFAMRTRAGSIVHLGSDVLGVRTYCGVILVAPDKGQISEVNCPACVKRVAWRYAQDQEAG